MPTRHWSEIVDLIESVTASSGLLSEAVDEVRATTAPMATLDAGDVARHTRALLAAASQAIAAQRGPTESELSFVEDLAVTRARQGISIEAVLSAIHVAERRIWTRARELAATGNVRPQSVLDARELYDDWAEAVRGRLIVAHRQAEAESRSRGLDRPARELRRMLDGGAAAALAAEEAGLPRTVHVVVVPAVPAEGVADLVAGLRRRHAVAGVDGGDVVAVAPGAGADLAAAISGYAAGTAGPAAAEEVPALRRLAGAVALAPRRHGSPAGLVHVLDAAPVVAIDGRGDLASALLDRHADTIATLGPLAGRAIHTTRVWLEHRRDADAAGAALFVHPNTVRNRVGALVDITGMDPADVWDAMSLWWLCASWERDAPTP